RAALSERRALEHHRRHACVGADQRLDGEHRAADQSAEHRCEQRLLEREAEVRSRDEDEDGDAEVRPEQKGVGQAEHPQALRYRLDSPVRSLHRAARQRTWGLQAARGAGIRAARENIAAMRIAVAASLLAVLAAGCGSNSSSVGEAAPPTTTVT